MGYETMGLGLQLNQRIEQRQHLNQQQKESLEQMLKLRLELRHPENPEMIRGLEGIKTGHEILKERNGVGVLIGGLAEAVWRRDRKPEELDQHKDIWMSRCVSPVNSAYAECFGDFEGGSPKTCYTHPSHAASAPTASFLPSKSSDSYVQH